MEQLRLPKRTWWLLFVAIILYVEYRHLGRSRGTERGNSVLLSRPIEAHKISPLSNGVSNGRHSELSLDFPWKSHPEMPRVLTLEQYREFLGLIQTFVSLMESANVTSVMYFGTLLGSYRMHNLLPWDDDVDLMIKYDDICKAVNAVKASSEHRAFTNYNPYQHPKPYHRVDFEEVDCEELWPDNVFHNFKFFGINSTQTSSKWSWPYIDVYLYGENETHVWPLDRKIESYPHMYVARRRFYPLTKRPFGPLWLPSPRDVQFCLTTLYGDFERTCVGNYWNHREERKGRGGGRIKCEDLRSHYPYVNRQVLTSGVEEELVYSGKTIHSVLVAG